MASNLVSPAFRFWLQIRIMEKRIRHILLDFSKYFLSTVLNLSNNDPAPAWLGYLKHSAISYQQSAFSF
jgi:hypothetical protein